MSDIPGLYEGVEAVKVLVNGTEVYLRLTGDLLNWAIDRVVSIATLIAAEVKSQKDVLKEGEVSFKELLDKDKSGIGMLQIEEAQFGLLERFAKESGVSYSIMPDINKKDVYVEVAFPESQGDAFRYFIAQHADIAKSYTYGEYFDNAIAEDIEAEIQGLQSQALQYAQRQVTQQPAGLQQVQMMQSSLPKPQQSYSDQQEVQKQVQQGAYTQQAYQQPQMPQQQPIQPQPVQYQQPQVTRQLGQYQPQLPEPQPIPQQVNQYYAATGIAPQQMQPYQHDLVPVEASLLSRSKTDNWVKVAVPNTKDDYIVVHKSAVCENQGQLYIDLNRLEDYMIVDAKERQKYDAGKQPCYITSAELKIRVADMYNRTRQNMMKQSQVKGTVKFVNRDVQGNVTSRIMKPGETVGQSLQMMQGAVQPITPVIPARRTR